MTCPLCGNDTYKTRKEGVRDNPEINVLECTHCGLVYLSHYEYTPDRVHKFIRDVKSWNKWTEADDLRRVDMLKDITENKLVLDFGCGNGGFLSHVKARSICGIEIDRKAKQYCKEHGIATCDSLDEVGLFDVITMFHVIEHIPNPIELLNELMNHLNDKGILVIETPNSNDALLSLYHCKDFAEFTYWSEHPFLYNHSTLEKLGKIVGYKVNDVKQYQRYSIANHLYWLSRGKPNGHNVWPFIHDSAYSDSLAALKKCDTIIAYMEKP